MAARGRRVHGVELRRYPFARRGNADGRRSSDNHIRIAGESREEDRVSTFDPPISPADPFQPKRGMSVFKRL
jgi:hypothetical protein